MIRRMRADEAGSAMITALLATTMMLALGLAMLAIVDTQADQSAQERTHDRAFNFGESVLTSEAFVLGRNWPEQAPASGTLRCYPDGAGIGDPGFGAPLGDAGSTDAVKRLVRNLNESYDPARDGAYTGASWKVNVCDDSDPDGGGPLAIPTVWDDSQLANPNWDANDNGAGNPPGNGRVWVRAEATVGGKTRVLAGLVAVRTTAAVNPRYALGSGGMSDDLGSSVDTITNAGVLGGVVSGLLDTTPTVAADPTAGATTPNGVTGLRCGALDILDGSTCVSGTLAATAAIPAVADLVTGDRLEHFPGTSSTPDRTIDRLRTQARASGTYTPVSVGNAPVASGNALNPTDTAPATVQACTITGTPSASTVVFIEQVGDTGVNGSAGGPGDQYCSIDVAVAKRYKAIVVASGRVVIRGNNTTTAASNTSVNTFTGVVYALNRQRLTVAEGGRGLGDGSGGREVLRIDRGAHVRGAVHADGKSGRVGIYPPPISFDSNALVDSLVPCVDSILGPVCTVRNLIKALPGGLGGVISGLLGIGGQTVATVTNGLLDQARPQRTSYGSAITADVAAITSLTVYGASGVLPGTFRDLQAR